MQESERDRKLLWDMLEACRGIDERMRDVSLQQYLANRDLQLIIERLFITLGEAANGVSLPFRQSQPALAWREIIDQRNLFTHGYDVIDDRQAYWTCAKDVPLLRQQLEHLLPEATNALDQR